MQQAAYFSPHISTKNALATDVPHEKGDVKLTRFTKNTMA